MGTACSGTGFGLKQNQFDPKHDIKSQKTPEAQRPAGMGQPGSVLKGA